MKRCNNTTLRNHNTPQFWEKANNPPPPPKKKKDFGRVLHTEWTFWTTTPATWQFVGLRRNNSEFWAKSRTLARTKSLVPTSNTRSWQIHERSTSVYSVGKTMVRLRIANRTSAANASDILASNNGHRQTFWLHRSGSIKYTLLAFTVRKHCLPTESSQFASWSPFIITFAYKLKRTGSILDLASIEAKLTALSQQSDVETFLRGSLRRHQI